MRHPTSWCRGWGWSKRKIWVVLGIFWCGTSFPVLIHRFTTGMCFVMDFSLIRKLSSSLWCHSLSAKFGTWTNVVYTWCLWESRQRIWDFIVPYRLSYSRPRSTPLQQRFTNRYASAPGTKALGVEQLQICDCCVCRVTCTGTWQASFLIMLRDGISNTITLFSTFCGVLIDLGLGSPDMEKIFCKTTRLAQIYINILSSKYACFLPRTFPPL